MTIIKVIEKKKIHLAIIVTHSIFFKENKLEDAKSKPWEDN